MINRRFAAGIEVTGISITSVGIGMEVATRADIYLGLITIGSVIFAVGTFLYAKITRGKQ